MKNIIEEWKNEMIPIVNGIVLPGGQFWPVQPMDLPRVLPIEIEIKKKSEAAISDATQWTGIIATAETVNESGQLKAIVGECGQGGDGFVALLDHENSDQLKWIAFFNFSNPFCSVSFDGEEIVSKGIRILFVPVYLCLV
jgi:hypothetical protein